jgi:hypothetical protein
LQELDGKAGDIGMEELQRCIVAWIAQRSRARAEPVLVLIFSGRDHCFSSDGKSRSLGSAAIAHPGIGTVNGAAALWAPLVSMLFNGGCI